GKRKTFAKVSTGLYFDRMFQNPITTTFFGFKPIQQQPTLTWTFGQAGAPTYPNVFPSAQIPANAPTGVRNVYLMPDKLEGPKSYQLVTTLDHAFADDIAGTLTFVFTKSWNKELLYDRNLAFNDATQRWFRLDPTYRVINQYSFTGRSEYEGLILEARKRLSHRWSIQGSMTLSRSRDQGNNFSSLVQDPRNPELEYGPSGDMPWIRVVFNGLYQITSNLQVSGIYSGRSGYNFDPLVGPTVDLKGVSQFNDRTPGFARNS